MKKNRFAKQTLIRTNRFALICIPFLTSVMAYSSSQISIRGDKWRAIVISDLHISNDERKTDRLAQLVNGINEGKDGKVSFVVATGDLVSSVYNEDDGPNAKNRLVTVSKIMSGLTNSQFFPLPGNHDYKFDGNVDSSWATAEFTNDQLAATERLWEESTGFSPYYSAELQGLNGWKILALSSMHGFVNKEHFGSKQLDWLETQLSSNNKFIMALHHPVEIDSGDFWLEGPLSTVAGQSLSLWGKGPVTRNQEVRFFEILHKYRNKIKLILVGHGHFFKQGVVEGIPIHATAAFGETIAARPISHIFGNECVYPRLMIEGDDENILRVQERCDQD